MKQFFTFISALLLTIDLSAQQQTRHGFNNQGRITISSLSNNPVRIVIDGKNYSGNGRDNEVILDNVRSGYHTIKVYQQRSTRSIRNNISRNMQLVYDATVLVRAKYHVDIIINRFGKAFVDEKYMNQAYYAQYDHDDHDNNDWSNSNEEAMSHYNFNQLKESLRNESFDNTRLTIAQQAIEANYFSATQVKDLLTLFSFEENKLQVAKFAYKNTVDKQNYFVVNEGLAYSSSREQLASYIRGYK